MKNIQLLRRRICRLANQFDGKPGIAFKNFATGDEFYLNADERFPTASVIKIPIMVEVFAQAKEKKIKLSDTLTYRKRLKYPGSGVIQFLSDGLNITILDATILMIILSDNTTTNMLLDLVGVKNINRRMEALGLFNTKVFRKAFTKKPEVEPKLCKKYGFGMSTPWEMNHLLELIYYKKIIDKPSCKQMIEIMKNQFYESQLRRWISGSGVWIANKTGAVDGVRNDVGIIHTPNSDWAISVFCKEVTDLSWQIDNQAQVFIAKLSKLIFDYYMG
ncbi:MAG: class A beta-lactamase-related serine hydrolase [bacterium]|nr:class A beta-lactamase-related serine hydrolase [bacterium]